MFGAKWETVRKWVERFEATGDVRDACRPGRPSKGLMLSLARLVIQRGVQKRFTCKKIAATVKTKLDIDVTAETIRGPTAAISTPTPLSAASPRSQRTADRAYWRAPLDRRPGRIVVAMGVGGFQKWMAARYPSAYVSMADTRVDHLYLDMSSLLHTVMRNSKTMDDFSGALFVRLNFILQVCKPTKSVVLAMDGPAPLAKLLTQRSRRKKSAKADQRASLPGGGARKKGSRAKAPANQKSKLSKQALTPGTPFISDVQRALEFFICQKLASRAWGDLEFELLGCAVEGEGELKIIERLAARVDDPADNHAILGGDSDLLLMALVAARPNLSVISDTQAIFAGRTPYMSDVAEAMRTHGLMAFSTDALRQVWQRAPESRDFAKTPEGLSELTLDFTTLSIVAGGNDYLSSVMDVRNLRTFTSADNGTRRNIWDQYLAHRADTGCGPLVQRSPAEDGAGGSEWGCWTAPLAVNLPALLAVMRASRGLQGFAPKASHTDFLPRHERGQTYLKGLAWCLNMYITGRCHDYRFVYHGTGPCIADFEMLASPEGGESQGSGGEEDSVPPLLVPLEAIKARWGLPPAEPLGSRDLPGRPLRPHVFALALMPASCYELAPSPLQHLLRPGSPVADIFRECVLCERLSGQLSDNNRRMIHMRKMRLEAEDALEEAEGKGEAEQAELAELERVLDQLTNTQREVERERAAHVRATHPYKPFPIRRLEQAVLSVPEAGFEGPDAELLSFGFSYSFVAEEAANGSQAAYNPPPPPVRKWSPLQLRRGLHIKREMVQEGGVCHDAPERGVARSSTRGPGRTAARASSSAYCSIHMLPRCRLPRHPRLLFAQHRAPTCVRRL
eukprot:jgi/Tetstr1/441521/TSEL_029751.t1